MYWLFIFTSFPNGGSSIGGVMKTKRIILFKFNELCKASKKRAVDDQEDYLCEDCEKKAMEMGLTKREAAIMSLETGHMEFFPSGELFVY